ncbi:MAG: chemotaxis protein CheA [Rubripirellula sp.]
MSETEEFIADFLEECEENLDVLEQELVALENDPTDAERLKSIFRTIHTIKGSSGFFGFSKLGALAHNGETLLGMIRDGKLRFSQNIAGKLLKMSDAVRELTTQIELTGKEGDGDYQPLISELQALAVESPLGDTDSKQDTGTGPSTAMETPAVEDDHTQPKLQALANPSDSAASEPVTETSNNDDTAPSEAVAGTIEASPSAQQQANQESTSIRVDVGLLNELMDLAGELVLARNELSQSKEVTESYGLSMLSSQLSSVTSAIQDRVMRTRMQPISSVFSKFKRIVRDVAVQCDKDVQLALEGEDTELDRTLLNAIRDPLTHIVRNSIDHGIESAEKRQAAGKPAQGKLLLRARHQSGQVVIEAIDDGGGIDVSAVRQKAIAQGLISVKKATSATEGQILQYIFSPGFSTAKQISSISGRGVGMDVVKTEIERIGGSVSLMSVLGVGTTVKITIPLTLAIVPALMVSTAGQRYLIPQASLLEVIMVDAVETAQNVLVCRLRDRLLPLIWLDELLEIGKGTGFDPAAEMARPWGDLGMHVAVLQAEDQRFGLVVDEVHNAHEVVVKPISAVIKSIGTYSAATLLGDGSASLILDVSGIARRAGLLGHGGEQAPVEVEQEPETPINAAEQEDVHQWLVCSVGDDREIAISLDSIEKLDEVDASQLQDSETGLVASYHGGVLPLVSVGSCPIDPDSAIPIVLHRRDNQLVGATVHRVLDIVRSPSSVTPAEKSKNPAVIGVTMAGGKVIDVVDLARVCR